MNKDIIRSLEEARGKNLKKLVEKSHDLYNLCSINILDRKQALKVLGNQEEFEIITQILTTNESLRKLYDSETKRVESTKKYISGLEKMTNYLKRERNVQTRKSNAITKEFEKSASQQLMNLSKESLVKVIIRNFPMDKIEMILEKVENLKDEKKNSETESSN